MSQQGVRKDISGHVFGQLLVLRYSHTEGKKAYWLCQCSCGVGRYVVGTALRSGNTKSCGHDRYKNAVAASRPVTTKHGMEGTPTYKSWRSMKERCLNATHKSYSYYKNVGICDRWVNSFEAFFSDMGERPEGTTLDRVDNDGDYNPKNCRWATHKEQARNRGNNRIIEFSGKSMCLAEWAEIVGLRQDTLSWRINAWGVEDALTRV